MTHIPEQRVRIIDEPCYTFGSADNSRTYDTEVDLTGGDPHSSMHGVIVDDRPTFVIGDAAGATGVHLHSILVLDARVFVAVGAHVLCFTLGNQHADWILKTDESTCFGIYFNREHDALISHGELSISRFSKEGKISWSKTGADIFSEGLTLLSDRVEAIDFNGRSYHFDYRTGQTKD